MLADFTRPFALPRQLARERTLVFFPGSTIGNLSRVRAAALLASIAERIGGALLLGVDVCHDPAVLHAAYNDSRGVTAAFNLNLLARLNRELGADFDLDGFEHSAVYDAENARIEMRLVSRRAQVVGVAGVAIPFRAGEHIVSEHSHKYSPHELTAMASRRRLASLPLLGRRRRAIRRLLPARVTSRAVLSGATTSTLVRRRGSERRCG